MSNVAGSGWSRVPQAEVQEGWEVDDPPLAGRPTWTLRPADRCQSWLSIVSGLKSWEARDGQFG